MYTITYEHIHVTGKITCCMNKKASQNDKYGTVKTCLSARFKEEQMSSHFKIKQNIN